ncbi:hypothetical protein LSAT2_024566 [Lamellibrachia satsuma]|nr:hypothetical protein LSAT2_024566 [Lamellibrachia satsuma]
MISGLHSTHQDESPTKDIRLQWRCLPFVYVVYRCLVALYFVTWLVLSGVLTYDWAASDDERIKWFIYLTNWAFFALTADVVLQAALVGGAYGKMGEYNVATQTDDDTNYTMPWYYKLMWVIHNVACNASFVTSLAYWVFIYKADMYVHVVDVHTHAVNSAYVLVDTFISAFPLRLLHFYHGLTFAVVYIIFRLVK